MRRQNYEESVQVGQGEPSEMGFEFTKRRSEKCRCQTFTDREAYRGSGNVPGSVLQITKKRHALSC